MFRKMCEHSNGWRPEDGVPDLAMMSNITADGINVNLRTRYQRDEIYTFSGSILIAVNPYKQLNIYDSDWIARYRQQKIDQTDPHIFALTEAMYMNLVMQDYGQHHEENSSSDGDASLSSSKSDINNNAAHQIQQSSIGFKNQACVISGESGAGKTETTKFILSYLCSVTPNKSIWMEHQILEANTILEAFGNAKTVRNDNSSRFGKFIQICFDSRHQINGCIIQDYLLEQSRITYQSLDERNYHVFYQLLAAGQTNQELRKRFHLMPANFYDYLNKTQCYIIEGVNDCSMFDSLRTAMSVLNMEQEKCDGLFGVLSAILWLGNLQFSCDESNRNEQCKFTDNDIEIIKIVSELLCVERGRLESILLKRQINVRGSITEIPFKIHEALDNRNAMAKALYSRIFTWTVNFINASTNPGLDNTCFLGVLDIFGFENFDTNSFEQLCINYANEKLHKFFNHHMFAMEQELYRREEIEFCDINYTDNTPCLELLERQPSCILRLLSEECRMPKGSDATFIDKLHNEFSSTNPNPFYVKGSDRRNWSSEFSVRHFAGTVTYTVDGFLKKNKDLQQSQLLDLIETSKNPLLKDLVDFSHNVEQTNDQTSSSPNSKNCDFISNRSGKFDNIKSRLRNQSSFCIGSAQRNSFESTAVRRDSSFGPNFSRQSSMTGMSTTNSSKLKTTVADAFRHQLSSLVELLNSVSPWYVRCIKPNLEKSATDYDDRQVLTQLKYLGMTDLIRIRREGYPIHLTKHQFVCRYRCLMLKHLRTNSETSPIKLEDIKLNSHCLRIINHFRFDSNDWKIGKTMVLLRTHIYQDLEEKRNSLFVDMATLIQSFWRGRVQRRKFVLMRLSATRIQESFRAFRGRLLYLRKKRAVLTIQAYCRGMFAREIVNALRELKRVEKEKEKASKLAQEQKQIRENQLLENLNKTNHLESEEPIDENDSKTDIVTTGTDNDVDNQNEIGESFEKRDELKTSPAVSSPASWNGQELTSETKQRLPNTRDKKEMEEVRKFLKMHNVSSDTLDMGNDADYERLHDVLGNYLQKSYDAQSISPSFNDDDHCSFATTGTNFDGDSVSCSGQSQLSSTLTDCDDDKKVMNNTHSKSQEYMSDSSREDTVNQNDNVIMQNLDRDKYDSNSIESIASIASSVTSAQNSSQTQTQPPTDQENQCQSIKPEEATKTDISHSEVTTTQNESIRTSTFTGNAIIVSGSKMVSNGRPLTRIEEEPNSMASSPSKTPCKSASRPQSLFPPQESDENCIEDRAKAEQSSEIKKRRLERRILQVQQEQLQRPINPTSAGVPTAHPTCNNTDSNIQNEDYSQGQNEAKQDETDAIYSVEKNNIIEYAEQKFNNHPRDFSGMSIMRTLTRRRKSTDANSSGDYLSKGDMLSYNPTFTIPTSHVKMHDPHNTQLSCSIFKNLCKYMTGESAKSENEMRIIQSIVRHGIEKIELRDEIYVQLTRQLTNNPNQDYCLRLWVLLGLVSAAFPPSKQFSKHLIAYLRSKPRKDPSITCQAQFCLDNLQTPRIGSRKYPPSLLEIQACKSLTNLTCKIHLLDGRCEILSVHPCDTASDALMKLAHRINLQSIEGWALYESYTPGASKYAHPEFENSGDFERTVRSHYFMADLIASWQEGAPKRSASSNASLKMAQKRMDEGNFKLTLKKRIFRGPKIRNDPVEISLLYSQAVHNVVKKDCYFVDENLAISLVGLQAQAALGNAANILNQVAPTKKGKANKNNNKVVSKTPQQVYEFENYICVRLRNQASRSRKDWCNIIAQAHKQFHNVNEVFCKMRYLSMVIYHCPLYGTATFDVTYKGYQTIDQNLMLGVNAEGLVLIRSTDKALINAYRYNDICKERGITVYTDERIIQLNVQDRTSGSMVCLSFECDENEEIATLMTSYSPMLGVYVRGSNLNFTMDASFDHNAIKKKSKLKMTLEDRMRAHQEVQNARKAIIRSAKLRKPLLEENNPSLLRHTLRRLSTTTKTRGDKTSRFENIYGTLGKSSNYNKQNYEIPQTSSDYNLYGNLKSNQLNSGQETDQLQTEVAGATAATVVDELTKAYPHRYWAYTKVALKNSLLTIFDPELEETALANFNSILIYSGLLNPGDSVSSSCNSTLETSSIDSGIVSQQSWSNLNGGKFTSNNSPCSASSNDIYDVCPKKMDEKDSIRLAQGILDRCLKKDADIVKNEFFLQLIKQTTDHPDPNSEINKRHWQLLALACSVTYPSDNKILSYLYAHLRRCSLDQVTDEGQYAQFTLRSLQGTLDTKGRRFAPSEMEILSTINCRRVYARVYFLDGQFQAVEFDPCATIAEVVEQIKQKIGLKPECLGYALFQTLDDDCEQVLQPEDKVGDAIATWESWQRRKIAINERQIQSQQQTSQNCNSTNAINKTSLTSQATNPKIKSHRFLFKRYLFLDNIMDINDSVERELQYFQTVASIKEDKFPVLEQEATILCALKAQIEIGDYTKLSNFPKEHIRMVYKQVVMSLMPPHAFNNLPLPAIAQQHQAFRELSCIDAKKYFFNLIQSFGRASYTNKPGFILIHRAHIYDATQTFATAWPSDIWIVINHSGLHMLVARSRRILAICEYRQIVDYSANNNYLIIIMLTNNQNKIKYTLYTKHAQQIAQQMKDYIVILGSSGGKKRRKSVEFNLRQQQTKPLDNTRPFSNSIQIQGIQ